MSIEKSLYQAPQGLETLEPDIEIEIEDPEAVHIEMDGVQIDIEPEEEEDFAENLIDKIDADYLESLASDLISDFDDDLNSRKDWIQTYVEGLELLGLKIEERTDPWPGACGVYHPLLTEALVKFQAETIMEILPAAGPVKTEIIGKETPEKKDASVRVAADMNHRMMDTMVEYRPETERLLWGLGLAGNAFKKVYYDPHLKRETAIYVPAEDVVVPYGASSLETAERVTHVMRKTKNEVRRLQVAGFYDDVDLGEPMNSLDEIEKKIAEKMGFKATSDDRFKLLEMHVDLDIPGLEHTDEDGEPTGIALPYVVTIEKGTAKCLAVRRNWRSDDDTNQKRQHFVHYSYIPGFGFYAFGLIHLIGAFAKSGTSLIRQLVDAGTLSNLPGGFKSRGLRVKGDDTPIGPGEFRDVDVASGTIRDNILPLPYKEPSQVLAGLLDKIIEEGRRFANAADMQISDMSANSPVGTTLAILERTLKTMSAIQARIHYSLKQELRLLKGIIRDYAPVDYDYEPELGDRQTKQSDYDMVDVIPVSDPNAATLSQKVVQYQAVIQLAQTAPQLYDLAYLHRQMLDVLGIKNASKLVKLEEDAVPTDPISENINVVKGKPVKAFLSQDHDAHIAAHFAFMQDPLVMQTLGQNPQANMILASLQSHIADHLGYQYRAQLEKQIGVALPEPDKPLPEEVEVQLSRLVATAAQQLLKQHQAQAAQQQAQQAAQDPVVQMQQQDLQIRAQEVQRKAAKDQTDAQAKMAQLQNDRMRIEADLERNRQQIEAQKGIAESRNKHDSSMEQLRMAVQVAKEKQSK
ncbi:hypothetical protein UFOVP274_5 [uncultured Caudovirales phage]|uniref:Uncharacterized protein n=1 Tax=uncultured Caudovirales phage TaxID=2100421 RepID=A0A6J5LMM7_9CAUD|nr:hypothetical protein UFOVP274_5 [uncultured Caudovirales phage]